MKRTLASIIVAVSVIIFLLLIAGIYGRKARALAAAEKISTLPDFILPALNGELFNSAIIQSGPVLITYFHPECEHCKYEITSLINSDFIVEDLKVLFISPANSFQLKSFFSQFDLKDDLFNFVLCDTSLIFRNIFNVDVIPSNYIYDKELKLVKALKGETIVEAIFKNFR